MIRIGVDFGGTKIEAAALDEAGAVVSRTRVPNPRDYAAALSTVRELVERVEADTGATFARVGIGIPGSISPAGGRVRNANSTWLNGQPFARDIAAELGRQVRIENDANCLALSEAVDGAGEGAGVVFAAILGTGVGGGVAVDGRLLHGRNGVAGEWGHSPLPWPKTAEHPGPPCWCGRRGCLERWLSGPAFAADHGGGMIATDIAEATARGDEAAAASLDRYIDRLGRALAVVADLIDPDAIVLGGGVSKIPQLYDRLPDAVAPHVFSDVFTTPILPAKWGDSSGVRGAARLWP